MKHPESATRGSTLPCLRVLTLNVTEACDAACRYCHWWKIKSAPEPLGNLLEAVDEAAALGAIAIRLSGGEPMLRDDLPQIVAHIRDRELVSMVCTAAKGEQAALEALLAAGLDVLAVSVDTLQPDAFHTIRGYGIDPVRRNIESLAKLRDHANFEIVLSVVLSRLSIDGIPELLEFVRSFDLVVSFTPFQDGSPAHHSAMSGLAFRDQDEPLLRDTLHLIQGAAAAGLRVINGDGFLGGIEDFQITRRLPDGHVCRAGDAAAIRLAGGELKLCHSLPGIVASGLETAWSSAAACELREKMANLDCPGCWLSCHADERRTVAHRFGRPQIWTVL